MCKRVWLIGGTQESATLAIALAQAQIPCIVTVTTETAAFLYTDPSLIPFVEVWVGRLVAGQIKSFIASHRIGCILDASHPFAVDISTLAIATASNYPLPYLRYERPLVAEGAREPESKGSDGMAIAAEPLYLDNFATLISSNLLRGERVLLTIGYRPLSQFQSWQPHCTLFARILPSVTALEAALAAGFTPDRLIALRPPVPIELERSLWQHWQISMVVTKASGVAGGEEVKRQLAAELGIRLVMIERPAVAYPQQTSDLKFAVEFCAKARGFNKT